ncbi:hypothetical protein BKA81DRAFT_165946 [Phyllosticta paracitricarpa]
MRAHMDGVVGWLAGWLVGFLSGVRLDRGGGVAARPSPAQSMSNRPFAFFASSLRLLFLASNAQLDSTRHFTVRPALPLTYTHAVHAKPSPVCLWWLVSQPAMQKPLTGLSLHSLLHCTAWRHARQLPHPYLPTYVSANPSARASRHTGRVSLVR